MVITLKIVRSTGRSFLACIWKLDEPSPSRTPIHFPQPHPTTRHPQSRDDPKWSNDTISYQEIRNHRMPVMYRQLAGLLDHSQSPPVKLRLCVEVVRFECILVAAAILHESEANDALERPTMRKGTGSRGAAISRKSIVVWPTYGIKYLR